MSGLLVWIGLNGPRISRGASGFMSQVSSWLGAPKLKIRMTDFSALPCATAPSALRAARFESVNPRAPSVPTCRKSRRVMPSQVVMEPGPDTFNITSHLLDLVTTLAPGSEADNRQNRWAVHPEVV